MVDICYALIKGGSVDSGCLAGPSWLGVLSNDKDVVRKIRSKSITISYRLNSDTDDKEPTITAIEITEDEALQEGIKVWV